MIIEGINAVYETLSSGGLTVEKLIISKNTFSDRIHKLVELAQEKKIRIVFENKELMDKISVSKRHQGVIAYATEFNYSDFDEILAKAAGNNGVLLILEGVEDAHNMGAIIRTAECAGVSGIIIPRHRSVGVNDTVLRTSAGAAAHIPIVKVANINDAIRTLKDNFFKVYAADTGGACVYDADLSGDIAIIIGGEDKGVSRLTKELSDGIISLPQFGKINSLNASVAAGILLYEVVRRRSAPEVNLAF